MLWFDGGHLAQVGRSDALRTVRRSLGALGFPGRDVPWHDQRDHSPRRSPQGPLLLDGAMGSLLYERGVLHTRSYDELNLVAARADPHASTTTTSHAGAELIETNTFGANRIALARHGLVDQAAADQPRRPSSSRAARPARSAYVAGAVGPTGVKFGDRDARRSAALARFALAEQIDTLVLAGVDAIMLETFTSILEMEEAIHVAKRARPEACR